MVTEPYYLLHFLTFFSYLPIRASASLVLSPRLLDLLLRREIQALLTFLVLSSVKMVREETWEGFVADTFLFAKIFLIVLSLLIDYHLTIWYIVVFLVLYTLTQQPPFQGLGSSHKLTPLQLETALVEGTSSNYWLIEFTTSCSSSCIRTSRCFPELSITYSNKNLSFGIVDIGLFPNVAEKFGISLGSVQRTPTYILFEKATEIARFPELGSGSGSFLMPVTKKCLVRHFDLDRLLIEYVKGQ
ncbi:hypothetical protein MLD38_006370 [Melastoma candidum]|uniref:Uncharacterized protein n=1 Tax=Melastoma candidum TaxID=119954 RepID=A0ACB9RRV2_9MYRT|nr:hypothetical protein MLD38_006370 [Melastoma candidum]